MKPHRATMILVFGVLSLIMCAPLGFFAWIMGNADLKEMAAGTMDPTGKDMTKIGKILGMIAGILLIIGAVIFLLMLVFGGLAAVLGGGSAS